MKVAHLCDCVCKCVWKRVSVYLCVPVCSFRPRECLKSMKVFLVFYVGLHKRPLKIQSAPGLNVLIRRSQCRQEWPTEWIICFPRNIWNALISGNTFRVHTYFFKTLTSQGRRRNKNMTGSNLKWQVLQFFFPVLETWYLIRM